MLIFVGKTTVSLWFPIELHHSKYQANYEKYNTVLAEFICVDFTLLTYLRAVKTHGQNFMINLPSNNHLCLVYLDIHSTNAQPSIKIKFIHMKYFLMNSDLKGTLTAMW